VHYQAQLQYFESIADIVTVGLESRACIDRIVRVSNGIVSSTACPERLDGVENRVLLYRWQIDSTDNVTGNHHSRKYGCQCVVEGLRGLCHDVQSSGTKYTDRPEVVTIDEAPV